MGGWSVLLMGCAVFKFSREREGARGRERQRWRKRNGETERGRWKRRAREKSFHAVVNLIGVIHGHSTVIHPSLAAAAQSKSPGREAAGGAECGAWEVEAPARTPPPVSEALTPPTGPTLYTHCCFIQTSQTLT